MSTYVTCHLAIVTPRQFFNMLSEQKELLLFTFSPSELTIIEDFFKSFRREYDSTGKHIMDTDSVGMKMFERLWKQFGICYEPLKGFCAGLASVFPETSTVESDFFRLRQDESKKRSNL